ncbi:MAG: hypothetical protein MUO54_05375 [Anaerolineales bacterium]|nr:hypothetical protein [Anaerolineales bacterium]
MIQQLQLIFKLIRDKRVHPLIKILPFLSLIYLVYPDMIPGPFDDAVVITLFFKFFMMLIPAEVISELKYEQEFQVTNNSDEDNIIEGKFWEE